MHRYHNPDNIVRHEPWYDPERDFVKVCHGACCADSGATEVMEALHAYFKGKDMQVVACPAIGSCHDGITVEVNTKVLYSQNPDEVAGKIQFELNNQAQNPQTKKLDRVLVCQGPTCGRRDGGKILKILADKYKDSDYNVQTCGCTGNCSQANNIVVNGRLIQLQNSKTAINSVKREMARQKQASNELVSSNDIETILGI